MKLDKLFHTDVLTGVVLGALIGLQYGDHLVGFKILLVVVGLIMGLKLVTK
jgi:hypothetical protein